MANKLLKLPNISGPFTNHVKDRSLLKNEWMPCPRCGLSEVTPPSGTGKGLAAGIVSMGCLAIPGAILVAIVCVVLGPIGIILGLGIGVGVLLAPLFGAGMGALYKCKSCSFIWTFKNVEELIRKAKGSVLI